MQATYERRFSKGLYFNANYTYSENWTNGQSLGGGNGYYRGYLIPGLGVNYDYARSQYDIPQVFHFSGGYDVPIGTGHTFLGNSRGLVDQLVSGWKTNFIVTLEDGYPFSIGCPDQTFASSTALACYADVVPGANRYAGRHNVNQWMVPAAFAAPPVATVVSTTDVAALGGQPMQVRGPGFHRVDFSVFKNFRTTERTYLQFRAEFFNLTNTPQFANPSGTNLGNSTTFGQITGLVDGANDPREIQFALKLYF